MSEKLASKFSNYQDALTLLPGVPTVFCSEYEHLFRPVLGRKKVVDLIAKTKEPGFVLFLEKPSPVQPSILEEKQSLAVFFIPTGQKSCLGKVVLIKSIRTTSDPANVQSNEDYLTSNLIKELDKDLGILQSKVDSVKSQHASTSSSREHKIRVDIILLPVSKETQLKSTIEKTTENLKNFYSTKNSSSFLIKLRNYPYKVSYPASILYDNEFQHRETQNENLQTKALQQSNQEADVQKSDLQKTVNQKAYEQQRQSNDEKMFTVNILSSLILEMQAETKIELTERGFNCHQFDPLILTNWQQVNHLFKLYFPAIDQTIRYLPDFNRICSTLLPRSERMESGGEEYLGEIKNFWERLLSKLVKPKGLLIHSYQKKHLDLILRKPLNRDFQYDWLLCSSNGFTIFEIARTKNPEEPDSTVSNKFKDDTLYHITTLQMFINSIISVNKELSESQRQFIRGNCVRLVLVFPNVTENGLKEAIERHKNALKVKKKKKKPESSFGKWGNVQILVPNANIYTTNVGMTLYKIDADLKLTECDQSANDIFNPTKQNVGFNEPEVMKTIQYVSALLSFSYLLCLDGAENNTLNSEPQKPIEADQKYSIERKNSKYLNIVSSPQQHGILRENERFVFIIGEPGSGKSAVLLDKACQAVQEGKTVLFCVPEEKTEFRKFISSFKESQKSRGLRMENFRLITLQSLANAIHECQQTNADDRERLTFEQLHESVLLIDEMYLDSTDDVTDKDKKLYIQAVHNTYHAKQCWITNLIAGQRISQKLLKQKSFLPNYKIEALNILFRSAHHISAFSTNFLNSKTNITKSSARVPGCFTSTQTEIAITEFSNPSEIKLNDEIYTSGQFHGNRWVIIFSEELKWNNYFSNENLRKITLVPPATSCSSASFTGDQALSVVIIIDSLPSSDSQIFPVINLAITRAQCEVCIFARSGSVISRVKEFIKTYSSRSGDIILDDLILDAANHVNADLNFLGSYQNWDENRHELVGKLFQLSIQASNVNLFKKLIELYPVVNKKRNLPITKICASLDMMMDTDFMQLVEENAGDHISIWLKGKALSGSLFDLIESALTSGFHEVLAWGFKVANIDHYSIRKCVLMFGRLMYCAFFNGKPSTIKWAIEFMDSHGLQEEKVREVGNTYKVFHFGKGTILLVLCYSHCEMESFEILFRIGFPNKLLLNTLLDKNALQYAIDFNDMEMVKILTRDAGRLSIFLGCEIPLKVNSLEDKLFRPEDYAFKLGYNEIGDYLTNCRINQLNQAVADV